jgi:hypothetical protein
VYAKSISAVDYWSARMGVSFREPFCFPNVVCCTYIFDAFYKLQISAVLQAAICNSSEIYIATDGLLY